MIGLLERRLDTVIYRAKFVPTVFAARQFISHGHIKVNGKRVTVASYRVKVGDEIEVKEKSKQLALVLEANALGERDVPDYIEVDHSKHDGEAGPRSGARRRALPGGYGAAPGRRILLAVTAASAASKAATCKNTEPGTHNRQRPRAESDYGVRALACSRSARPA